MSDLNSTLRQLNDMVRRGDAITRELQARKISEEIMTPTTWDCAHKGHHFHEADGSVFARERKLGETTEYPVSCCHCGATAVYTGYGKQRAFEQSKSVLCAR